jgi:hypothetical protein
VLRLDVAVVGFVVFTLLAPLGGGYLAAWLVNSAGNVAMVALLAGGTSATGLAAALGSSSRFRFDSWADSRRNR